MAVVVRRYKLVGPSNNDLDRYVGASAAQSALFPVEVVDISINDATAGAATALDEYMAMVGWVYDPAAVPGGPLASTAPTQIDVGDLAVVGVATEAARADHQHALPVPAVVATLTPDNAPALGVSAKVAREDHVHGIAADVAVTTGSANAEGTSASFSRADHVHIGTVAVQDEGAPVSREPIIDFVGAGVTATAGAGKVTVNIPGGGGGGITVAQASATANTTLVATVDTAINSMSLVAAAAGNYMVDFTSSATPSDSSYEWNYAIYLDAVVVAESRVRNQGDSSRSMPMVTHWYGAIGAGQTVTIKAKNSLAAQTTTIHERILTLTKVS